MGAACVKETPVDFETRKKRLKPLVIPERRISDNGEVIHHRVKPFADQKSVIQ